MVTKREVAAAQQALNEAVGYWLSHRASPPYGLGSGYEQEMWEEENRDNEQNINNAYATWDSFRKQLDGEGPAVARSTSIAAAKSKIMLKQSVRRDILQMVVAHWNHYGVGMTSDEILARLRGKHQTVSARVSELVNTYQLLVDSGQKKNTSMGSKAIVWRPTDEAIALVAAAVTGRTDGA